MTSTPIEPEAPDAEPHHFLVRIELLRLQSETVAQVDALARDLGVVLDASALVATDDEHDPEGATIAFERAQLTAVLEQARQHLVDLAGAIERLESGAYGVCVRCGRQIGPARLAARPTASTCIACAAGQRTAGRGRP